MLPPDPLSPGGRGLAIVAGLAKEWGVRPEEHGKSVWFTLAPLPAAVPLAAAEPLLAAALAWSEPADPPEPGSAPVLQPVGGPAGEPVPEPSPEPVLEPEPVPALEPALETVLARSSSPRWVP
ncbi:ATP-binding protein [Streptacidiphilus monticola]